MDRRAFLARLGVLGTGVAAGSLIGLKPVDAKPEGWPMVDTKRRVRVFGSKVQVGGATIHYWQEIERRQDWLDKCVYVRSNGKYWMKFCLPHHLPITFPMHDPHGFYVAKDFAEHVVKEYPELKEMLDMIFDREPRVFWGEPGPWTRVG